MNMNNVNSYQLIENITQKVYEQLLIKKQNEIMNRSVRSLNENDKQNRTKISKSNKSTSNNNNNNKKLIQTNSIFINPKRNNKQEEIQMNEQDLEESKLIEDLFFLK